MKQIKAVLLVVSVLVVATGCSSQRLTGDTYSYGEAQREQRVRYATVMSVTPVVIEGKEGAVGTLTGAAVGGIAGSTVGGGRGRALATVIGSVAGGIIGEKVQKDATRKQGQEITLRLRSGDVVSVVQEVGESGYFRSGDNVRILKRGSVSRVVY